MKSSNLVEMNERLNLLRFSLGVDWGELAKKLEISRSMLGFIRTGIKTPGPKLSHRISELEKTAGSKSVATCQNCEMLLKRVIELEAQLIDIDLQMKSKNKAALNFLRSVEVFKREFTSISVDDKPAKQETCHE